MSTIRNLLVVLVVGVFIGTFSGCERKGPAERTGEQIDKAVEGAGKKIDEAGDKARDAVK